jgi:hypothetical protein
LPLLPLPNNDVLALIKHLNSLTQKFEFGNLECCIPKLFYFDDLHLGFFNAHIKNGLLKALDSLLSFDEINVWWQYLLILRVEACQSNRITPLEDSHKFVVGFSNDFSKIVLGLNRKALVVT